MPEAPSSNLTRNVVLLTVAVVVAAALYLGWVFYSRASDADEARRARTEKEAADARKTVDLLGGGQFKILNFYAVPGAIKRGSTATVCYGVSEAKSVSIKPAIEPIEPAISRCIQASPRHDTEYTLTADDGKGHTATESLTIKVLP